MATGSDRQAKVIPVGSRTPQSLRYAEPGLTRRSRAWIRCKYCWKLFVRRCLSKKPDHFPKREITSSPLSHKFVCSFVNDDCVDIRCKASKVVIAYVTSAGSGSCFPRFTNCIFNGLGRYLCISDSWPCPVQVYPKLITSCSSKLSESSQACKHSERCFVRNIAQENIRSR